MSSSDKSFRVISEYLDFRHGFNLLSFFSVFSCSRDHVITSCQDAVELCGYVYVVLGIYMDPSRMYKSLGTEVTQ